ncbi:U4/U6 small nuclear ribonucleoprotein Prp31-like isoform X2 [Halichondria panicea]|uniref:U4/U6 small nuclear ribonucleoprotein Prp31-like isoform X2 n=1 Tax=Halichondria panicea TaxID=6063 RepID=UPI00312B6F7E
MRGLTKLKLNWPLSLKIYLAVCDLTFLLMNMMGNIDCFLENPRQSNVVGPVEADPEYQLIVDSNNMAVEIDNETTTIHKFIKDKYSKRFPELESLVHTPLEYIQTVKLLQNELEVTRADLSEVLPAATIMVVSVTASTTQGHRLEEGELQKILEACEMALEINSYKIKILAYVESRMSLVAPNLSRIVGPTVAAKLMGIAGGLTSLSKMPACNILVVGAQKKTLAGFSTASVLPHTGVIYYSEMVQNMPQDARRKAARLLAAKSTLAARVDSFHESPDGSIGERLATEVRMKFNKILEPPHVKAPKPLPKPDDLPRKKRGGRRVRKQKERYAQSEMRKQANRMTFGEIQEDAYQEDLGFTTGQLGKGGGTGPVRGPTVDKKTQVSISKRLQRQIQKAQVFGGKSSVRGTTSGTASSVAFTPLQGLEIVNPMAAEKRLQEANQKYFSSAAGFRSQKPTI